MAVGLGGAAVSQIVLKRNAKCLEEEDVEQSEGEGHLPPAWKVLVCMDLPFTEESRPDRGCPNLP